MPSNDHAPLFAWTSDVDTRAYNAASLFDMGGGVVSGPAVDYFPDVLNFLNGRCTQSGLDLDAEVKSVKGATWSIYLDVDDLVVIEDTAGAFTLEVAGGSRVAFGFAAAGIISSVVVGATNQIKATADWVRGNVQNAHLRIDDGVAENIPAAAYRAQDVITMLRSSVLADADGGDGAANLEASTVAAYGAGGYRWGINATGFAWLAVDSASGTAPDGAGTWLNDDFQRWLGFKGDEAVQTVADAETGTNLEFIEGSLECASCMPPTRPQRRPSVSRFDEKTSTARLTSGEIASNKVMDWRSWVIEWWLDGPADSRDLSNHWLNAFVARSQKGARWTLYQVWGDPRRARFTADVRTDLTGTTPAYDLVGTAELDGTRGRIRGRRGIGDAAQKANRWPASIRRRIPMTTILEAAED